MRQSQWLALRLPGVRIQLVSDCPAWLALVRRHWAGWVTEEPGGFFVACMVEGTMGAASAGQGAAGPKPVVRATARGFALEGGNFSAEVDLQAQRALLRGPATLAPLVALLPHLLTVLMNDGLVVHGVGLAEGRRGWVGAGPSGCGKSTLARLFPGAALSDELVAVRRGAEGFMVEALPFWASASRQAPLAAIHFLRHGRIHQRHPLAPGQALQRLAAQVVWPFAVPRRMATSLALAAELVQGVPCFELAFAPEMGVWRVLTGEEQAA